MCASENINVVPESLRDFSSSFGRSQINWDDEWGKINKLSAAIDSCRKYKLNDVSKTDFEKQQLDYSLQQVRNRIETVTGKFQALIETLNYAGQEYGDTEALIAEHFGGSINERSTKERGYNAYLNWYNQLKQRYGDNILTKAFGSDFAINVGTAAGGTTLDCFDFWSWKLFEPEGWFTSISTFISCGYAESYAISFGGALIVTGFKAIGQEENGYRVSNAFTSVAGICCSKKDVNKRLGYMDHFKSVTGHHYSEAISKHAQWFFVRQKGRMALDTVDASLNGMSLVSNYNTPSSNADQFLKSW